MKKVPVYILLFLYTAVQLKPLTAVIQDTVAHTFFAMQHMATVHYENGKYHLHKELRSISEQEQGSQKTASSEKITETTAPQNITGSPFKLYLSVTSVAIQPSPDPGLHEGFTSNTFRPPLVA